jgi:hypothetical protein
MVGCFKIKEFSSQKSTAMPRDRLEACHEMSQNLKMLRGVTTALHNNRSTVYTSGVGGILLKQGFLTPKAEKLSASAQEALGDLQIMIDTQSPQSQKLILQETLSILNELYLEITALLQSATAVDINQVFKFHARASWDFISLIHDGNDCAVITHTYSAVLSSTVKGTWCMDTSFGTVMLRYSRHVVSGPLQYLLDWPDQQCESGMASFLTQSVREYKSYLTPN